MRIAVLSISTFLVVLLAGCVIPTPKKVGVRGKITTSALEFLQEGRTPRADVLLHLGRPDHAFMQESVFAYKWSSAWDVCFVSPFPTVAPPPCTEYRKDFTLMIWFDDQGIVSRFEKRKR